jgi:betaine-homocysteine S-methyltransferase
MTLQDRLSEGPVLCAEGYLFELERRGYLQAGAFVPEVVLEQPEKVAQLHEDFVHAGSDVVEAFTYYAHREKLRVIGREHHLEPLNRGALDIAKRVAVTHGALLAGNVCNTNVYKSGDAASAGRVREMFVEQVAWIADAGVDFVIGETFWWAEEALLALEVIRDAGLPAVITLAPHRSGLTREGWSYASACERLAAAGADVVGLNCIRGPQTMLGLLDDIVAAVDVPVAALPVPYRTHAGEPTFQSLRDPAYDRLPGDRPFPTALDPFTCNRYEIADFTVAARRAGVTYFGLCCGAAPHHVRAMAEALGRTPPASRFSADMTKHAFLGTDRGLARQEADIATQL